jgi:hypothetical protein
MDHCSICHDAIDGPRLSDARDGSHAHAACVARALPQDAVATVLAAVALVLLPPVFVWAG